MYTILEAKGTNCTGKSYFPLRLRAKGWEETVHNIDGEVRYTRFRRGSKRVYVLGRYGEKGGGCDGLNKDQMLRTIEYLWNKPGHIYFEGQNLADTLTTHILWMLKLQYGSEFKPSFASRGTLPNPLESNTERKPRRIRVLSLTAPLSTILERLRKRTPGKVLKNNAAKTTQKYKAVLNQHATMKTWKEVKKGLMEVELYHNTGTKKQLFKTVWRILNGK